MHNLNDYYKLYLVVYSIYTVAKKFTIVLDRD